MIAALFDLPEAEPLGLVEVDGVELERIEGGTLLAPICLRPACRRPWQECQCPTGPHRWSASSGVPLAEFPALVRSRMGGA